MTEDVFGGPGFGFDAIERALRPPNPEEQYAAALDTYEHAAHFHRCFSTPDGQYVLAEMRKLALGGPRFDAVPFSVAGKDGPRLVDGLTMAMQGFYREGSASWYFFVEHLLARAEQGPPTAQEKPESTNRRKR